MTDREHRDDLTPSAMASHLREASRLVENIVGANNLLAQAADHIERLHKDLIIALELKTTALRERDELVQQHLKSLAEISELEALIIASGLKIAKRRGWNWVKGDDHVS